VNDIGNASTTTSTVTNTAIVSEDDDRPRRTGATGWARFKGRGSKDDQGDASKKSKDASPADVAAQRGAAAVASEQQYREIVKNMSDFKVDMKTEIGRMNDKINRMEELMTDFISKLSAALPKAADEDRERRRGAGAAGRRDKARSRSRSKVSPTETELPDADGGGGGGASASGTRGRPRSEPQSPSHGNGRIHFVPGQREEFL